MGCQKYDLKKYFLRSEHLYFRIYAFLKVGLCFSEGFMRLDLWASTTSLSLSCVKKDFIAIAISQVNILYKKDFVDASIVIL